MPEARRCVQCRQRPADPRYRPFCSERCRTIDLGRWLSGEYRVAGPDGSVPDTGPHDAEPDEVDFRQ